MDKMQEQMVRSVELVKKSKREESEVKAIGKVSSSSLQVKLVALSGNEA